MNAAEILKFIISDIFVALIISSILTYVSNKKAEKGEEQLEKSIEQIKDHLDLRLDQQTLEVKNAILESEVFNLKTIKE